MNTPLYVIGSEPLYEWEQRNNNPSCIILTGDVSADTFAQCAQDFDYTRYKQITFGNLTVQDMFGSNGYTCSYHEHLFHLISEYAVRLSVLVKLFLNLDTTKAFVVSDGWIWSADGKTLVHVPETNKLIIPNCVEHIGHGACCGYDKMSSVKLNWGLKSIGRWAFVAAGIVDLDMPNTLVSLGDNAFLMADLEKVRLSNSLTEILDGCFDLCSLENIEIPQGIKSIGNKALRGLIWTDEIDIPEGVERIGYDVFEAMYRVSLPSTLTDIAPDFYYEDFIDDPDFPPYIDVHRDNKVFYSKDGSLYFKTTDEIAIDSKYNGPNKRCIRFQYDDKKR